ncbi:porin [Methylophilus sp. QUAN]|uniref:porin n=1 Tax=Methylophilus sp. QUAN TaxID=2781020 RepID=UPI00188F1451|nr:porin [Methylophilus sp. QUAN]MBF4991800.1 porin [Methylophilus sp. QUAN]
MKKNAVSKTKLKLVLAQAMLGMVASNAHAGATISFGEDKFLHLGLGLRAAYTSASDGAADGKSRSNDFDVYSTRIYTSAQLNRVIKGTLNLEGTHGAESTTGGSKLGENFEIYEAIAQFEFAPEFNLWAGRMLTPSDRSNLDGPYFLSSWLYPGVVAQYPSQLAGRDTGVTVWGKLIDQHLIYSVGSFEGHNNFKGASSEDDNLLYAGRVQYDFWGEGMTPAYYTASTFYGKDYLSIGFASQYQKNGVGSANLKGDYLAYNADLLWEKDVGFGFLDVEAGIYKFDTDGRSDVSKSLLTSTPSLTANVGGIKQGKAYLFSSALLFPQQIGWGKLQPYFRYQKFDADSTKGDGGALSVDVLSSETKQYDYGVHYVIDGHNARLSATYTKNDYSNAKDENKVTLGVQLQF